MPRPRSVALIHLAADLLGAAGSGPHVRVIIAARFDVHRDAKPVSASGLCTQNPPRSPARRKTRDRPRPADQRFLALQSSLAQTRHFGREALVASGRSGLGRPPPGAPLRRQPLPAPGSRRQSLALLVGPATPPLGAGDHLNSRHRTASNTGASTVA